MVFVLSLQSNPRGRKNIYDPNFLKSGDYEQPTQEVGKVPQTLDDGYGSIRQLDQPDSSYGDLNDISVEPDKPLSAVNEYLNPGDSLGHHYQNPAALQSEDDDDHEYHEVDEDKPRNSSDDGYEHPPDFDHEYHEVSDLGKIATLDGSIKPQFDSPEYMSSGLLDRHGSLVPLVNSNQNNNETEYSAVTDDMLVPPHKRGDTIPSVISNNYQNLQGSDTQL